jgi:hypothetical protein
VTTDADFPLMADEGPEDLPRTLRREREARQRARREEEARKRGDSLTHDFAARERAEPVAYAPDPVGGVVTRIDVPFFRLAAFFIKAVFAAIPALIILGTLLWFAGQALKTIYPELVHTEVIIRVPR